MPEATDVDLRVKIPERFKESFSRRFDPARAVLDGDIWAIPEPCGLCREFCGAEWKDCPLRIFRDFYSRGCGRWLRKVLGITPTFSCGYTRVSWVLGADTLAREQLTKLRARAEELIEWTTDTPKTKTEKEREMRLIGTITPVAKSAETLANLEVGVLAIVDHDASGRCRRFHDGEHVLGLTVDGQLVVHSHTPQGYRVVEVLGPLTFNFED